jgi:hypothetical protein
MKHLDESNLVGDIEGIDISGELDVGLLVTIGANSRRRESGRVEC